MQAIITKYHGPTDTQGARISATAEAGRIYVPLRHDLDTDARHRVAAQALADKMGWTGKYHGRLVGGAMPKGKGYAFTFDDSGLLDAAKDAVVGFRNITGKDCLDSFTDPCRCTPCKLRNAIERAERATH